MAKGILGAILPGFVDSHGHVVLGAAGVGGKDSGAAQQRCEGHRNAATGAGSRNPLDMTARTNPNEKGRANKWHARVV